LRNSRITKPVVAASFAAALFAGAFTASSAVADDDNRIVIRDDCDPDDPAWAPTGGCALEDGDVRNAEFGVELGSTLAPTSVIGHQAWRNDPPYLKIKEGETVRVRNRGGRTHTLTKVANFGGGRIPNPALNRGLATAPECPGSASGDLAPGASAKISGLTPGNHRFQCCIHPWMRAIVKVLPDDDDDDDEDEDEDEN
jgi:plastocyanin